MMSRRGIIFLTKRINLLGQTIKEYIFPIKITTIRILLYKRNTLKGKMGNILPAKNSTEHGTKIEKW